MKMLILLGVAALATTPFLVEGERIPGEGCCKKQCPTDSVSASLASVVLPDAAPAYDPDSTGSLRIMAKFEGDVPEPLPPLVIDASKSEGCATNHALDTTDRSRLIAKDGAIANVVVTLEIDGQKPELPADPVDYDQRGCQFEPRVAVLPAGARVRFKNSDGINHNVHTFAKKNDALNRNIAGGSSEEQLLAKDETIEIKCDIHPWMKGYLVVTEAARFGVTGVDGWVTLEGLPPGEYKVKYWHETLGKGTSEAVSVAAGSAAELELAIGGEAKKGRRGR